MATKLIRNGDPNPDNRVVRWGVVEKTLAGIVLILLSWTGAGVYRANLQMAVMTRVLEDHLNPSSGRHQTPAEKQVPIDAKMRDHVLYMHHNQSEHPPGTE